MYNIKKITSKHLKKTLEKLKEDMEIRNFNIIQKIVIIEN